VIRLLNRDFLGGHTGRNNPSAKDNAVQDVPGIGGTWCGPAYWEGPGGPTVFFTGSRNRLRSFHLGVDPNQGGKSMLTAAATNSISFRSPSSTPVVSSNGPAAGTGILWLLRRDDNSLLAFNAEDLTSLWKSTQGAGTSLGGQVVKFTVPVVANGRVYATMKTDNTHGRLVCYGLKGPG
jgi:outer membrane protein assembly factor BamB